MAAARDEARLLLPSPLGLLEYDLLEGATFVGLASRGGLEAAPRPFARAALVVAREGEGHVVRALSGTSIVMVDGAAPTACENATLSAVSSRADRISTGSATGE